MHRCLYLQNLSVEIFWEYFNPSLPQRLAFGAQEQSRTSTARGGSHPASGGGNRLPGRAAGWSQLKSTPSPWTLPSAECSPVLPGPTDPDPISGLTSWTGLRSPVPVTLCVYPRAVSDPVHLTGSDPVAIAPSTSAIPENVQIENLWSCLPHVQNNFHKYLQFFKDCTSDMFIPFR